MALISQRIESLLNGVSQLPAEQRLASQLTEQINTYSHRSKGLMKRPGSKHIAQLTSTTAEWDRAFVHVIDRDSGERYYLCLVAGDIRLYDALTGAAQPISFPQGLNLFRVPDAKVTAEFTQPNAGTGIWWDGTTFTAPSGLSTYRYGPNGLYKFVTPPSGLQLTDPALGIFLNRVAVQGIMPPPPPPDQYGASQAFCTSTYPVPNPDVTVEMNVGHSLLGTSRAGGGTDTIASWSRRFWLSARQQGLPDAQGRRYVLVCVPVDANNFRWEIGITTGIDLFYSTIGASGPNLPNSELANAPSFNRIKFEVRTEQNGDVTLKGYRNGVVVIERSHVFSTGETLGTGWAGFWVQGDGIINAPGDTPQDPNLVVPRGYTVVDNFTIASGRTMSQALPFGIGPMYKCLTVGDRTYICNTLLNTDKLPATTAPAVLESLIYIRQADYSTTYTVIIQYGSGTLSKSYTTGDGNTPASRQGITTENVAEQLKILLAADATLTAQGFTFSRTGSVIYITRTGTVDYNVICRDGLADDAIISIKGSVQRFEDLPVQSKDGVILEVKGDPGSEFDNYFVKYEEAGKSGTGYGTWKECPKPDEEYQLDPNTMPWVLTREPSGAWTCEPGSWAERVAGSLVTNPFPSFVGFPIKEMFYREGRLGFLSNENVILSETNKPFNFFRKSAKALYDSDAIDIKGAFAKSMVFQNAILWNDECWLWSNTAQVVLDSEGPLSPRTVNLRLITAYENRPSVKPFVIDKRVFYHAEVNGKTRIGEYYIPQFTGKPNAIDATINIPSYISGIPVSMAGADPPGLLAVATSAQRDTIYVHSYLWAADTKVQSSWSKWTMPAGSTVVAVDFYLGKLTAIVLRSDGVFLETMDVGSLDAPGIASPVLIDRRVTNTDTGVSATFAGGETEWTVPYTQASDLVVVRQSDGTLIPTTQTAANKVKTTGGAGDLTATAVFIGVAYARSLTLSRIYRRKFRGSDEVVDPQGRLQLKYLFIESTNSGGVYVVTVTPQGRTAYTYNHAGEARYQVPIQSKNDASIVISDTSVLSCAITALDWEGSLTARNRRV